MRATRLAGLRTERNTRSDPALSAYEDREHAEHAAHEHDPLKSRVSITIAVMVVLAATSGSLQTIEAGGAIIAAIMRCSSRIRTQAGGLSTKRIVSSNIFVCKRLLFSIR